MKRVFLNTLVVIFLISVALFASYGTALTTLKVFFPENWTELEREIDSAPFYLKVLRSFVMLIILAAVSGLLRLIYVILRNRPATED